MWARSVQEAELEILCVSQFTLCADLRKPQKPAFHNSMKPDMAKNFYEKFVEGLKAAYKSEAVQSMLKY
jgi:D-tyrosyl-tRNA(Tyr) deacylase